MKRKELIFALILTIGNILLSAHSVYQSVQRSAQLKQISNSQKQLTEKQQDIQYRENNLKQREDVLMQMQIQINEDYAEIEKLKKQLDGLSINMNVNSEVFNYVVKSAKENGYDPQLLFGIIQQESNWNSKLVSATNDYGLCQINTVNIKEYRNAIEAKYGYFDVFNVYMNIDMMIMNLNEFRQLHKNIHKTDPTSKSLLWSYNSGKVIENYKGNSYTTKVLGYANQYKKWLDYIDKVSNS